MSTIDDERLAREVDAAGPTVREVHQAVRVARLSHCRHGRARTVHRGRVRRRPISEYRPAELVDTTTQLRVVRTDIPRNRRPVRAVVAAAAALSLLYVGFVRVFESDVNDRFLVIGVFDRGGGRDVPERIHSRNGDRTGPEFGANRPARTAAVEVRG